MAEVEIIDSTVVVTIDATIPKVVEAIPNAVFSSSTNFTDNPIAGEDIPLHRYVIFDPTDGRAFLATVLDLTHATRVVGISLTSALMGERVEIATDTFVVDTSWNWDVTRPLLLGDQGQIVQAPIANATFNLQVASTTTSNRIAVDVEEPTIL